MTGLNNVHPKQLNTLRYCAERSLCDIEWKIVETSEKSILVKSIVL